MISLHGAHRQIIIIQKAMQSEILILLQSEAEIVMGISVEDVKCDVTTQN